jgi:hypothetical protein
VWCGDVSDRLAQRRCWGVGSIGRDRLSHLLLMLDDLGNAMPDLGSKAAQAKKARAANKSQIGVNPTDRIICLVRVSVGNAAYFDRSPVACSEMLG